MAASGGGRVLVTGASGFIGHQLVSRMTGEGRPVRASVRQPVALPAGAEIVTGASLTPEHDWSTAARDCDTVVHTAARVHVMREGAADPLAEFRRSNVAATVRLARQAASAGVRRFVYLSSIKVNGEGTAPGRAYRAGDAPAPVDPYGVSKREAEDALREVAWETGLEVAIIRPVLVYGPGVRGNFLAMMRWLWRGLPSPLGAVDNRRSLVGVDNLVDLIVTTIDAPSAANRTFLVSDGVDLSTPELLKRTAQALGTRARIIPVPTALLRRGASALGRGEVANRLLGSLQVDISDTRSTLGWNPPTPIDIQLARTADWFRTLPQAR